MPSQSLSKARSLSGHTFDTGWTVGAAVERGPGATGGAFSCCYIATGPEGELGFLKVLDYTAALQMSDPASVMNAMTASFLFERELLDRCGARGLDRVVRPLTHGTESVAGEILQYIVFETATGDIRHAIGEQAAFNDAMALRSLHHVATGLFQLHGQRIAHQDLKPSNILVFDTRSVGAGRTAKIGDLGRASSRGDNGPNDQLTIPGDFGYAPPELLYGYAHPDWNVRRLGTDMYGLGGLVTFLFCNASVTALLMAEMPETHHWRRKPGPYEGELPLLVDAFDRVLHRVQQDFPEAHRQRLLAVVQELSHPDLARRGHPRTVGTPMQYSLERYVSLFDLLARQAESRLSRLGA